MLLGLGVKRLERIVKFIAVGFAELLEEDRCLMAVRRESSLEDVEFLQSERPH